MTRGVESTRYEGEKFHLGLIMGFLNLVLSIGFIVVFPGTHFWLFMVGGWEFTWLALAFSLIFSACVLTVRLWLRPISIEAGVDWSWWHYLRGIFWGSLNGALIMFILTFVDRVRLLISSQGAQRSYLYESPTLDVFLNGIAGSLFGLVVGFVLSFVFVAVDFFVLKQLVEEI
jgi:hypothetical protein